MRIENHEIKEHGDVVEVSADIDGFRLRYRLPKLYKVSRAGDPFLAAAIHPAMLKGEKLEIDPSLPVSPTLLKNVSLLQEIFHSWNPKELKIIPVTAATLPAGSLNSGAFSFFSGGVDSMYTFMKRMKEISHAVFIQGLDFYLDSGTYQTAITRNSTFVQSYGKTLIPVETNHYPFGYRYNLSRNLTHGGALASVALLLGFPRVYIPASDIYSELAPLGSHPVTDPLWSNENVEIIHDGAEACRTDKLRKIVECSSALANLRVCFDDMNTNCGKCAKCLRTMITLKLLSASNAPFPPLPSLRENRASRTLVSYVEMPFLKENIELALQSEDKELRAALCSCMKSYERKQLLKEFDRVFLGGIIKRAYRRVAINSAENRRVDSTPPKE